MSKEKMVIVLIEEYNMIRVRGNTEKSKSKKLKENFARGLRS